MKFKVKGEEEKRVAEVELRQFGDWVRLYINDIHVLSIKESGTIWRAFLTKEECAITGMQVDPEGRAKCEV